MGETTKGTLPQGQGKWTARARVDALLDAGSFVETNRYLQKANAVPGRPDVCVPGEGVVTGWGTIDGQAVCIAAQDSEALGGAFGAGQAEKIAKAMDMAAKSGYPMLFLWDSNGAKVQEGAAAMHAYTVLLRKMVDLSGVVPTISVAAGAMLGTAALFAPLSDFTFVVEGASEVGLKGATVTAAALGLEPDAKKLNGAAAQMAAGNAQFCCADEPKAYEEVKRLLLCLPSNNLEDPPFLQNEDPADRPVTADPADVFAYARQAADGESFLEVQPGYGEEIRTGFASFGGMTCGVVANAGGKFLTDAACEKAARFVRILDAYDMPILTFVDNEGVEAAVGHPTMRALAKLSYAYAEAGSPMVSVLTGKAIGEGYAAMSNKGNGADLVYALPQAKIGCMNAEAGSIVLFGGTTEAAADYAETYLSAESAAKQGVVDDIVAPEHIRETIVAALLTATDKREQKPNRKHGIMPL